MTPSRDSYYQALFALLQGLKSQGVVKVCDRRLRFLDEMSASELPALFMAVDHQQTTQQRGLPPRRTLGAKVFLYAANPDRHTPAGVQLNGLIDAVEQALAPDSRAVNGENVQTLGGSVSHAWIEGAIEVFEGPQGQKAAAILSVQMLLP